MPIWLCRFEAEIVDGVISDKPALASGKHGESPDMNVGDNGTVTSLDQEKAGERLNDGIKGIFGSVVVTGEPFKKPIS